jgi:stage II sporulation protein D
MIDIRKGIRIVTTAGRYALRIGVGLFVLALVWSCAGIPALRDESMTPVIRIPFIRVLLVESKNEVAADADGSFAVECLDNGKQTVYYSRRPVAVSVSGRGLRVADHNGSPIQEGMNEVNLIPRGPDTRLRLDNKRYRGIIKVLPYGQNVRLINVVYMEDYLRGVVPPEIGQREDSEIEAVKAQAVAARTYAMGHLQQYEGEPYDMKSTVADQLYEGLEAENKLVNRAIDETAGRAIMFQDNFINAYYHSTCGGMTDDIAEVWDKPAAPYLVPVDDSSFCSWSKYYSWQEQFNETQLRGRIEQYLSSDRGKDIRIAPITDVTILKRTPGGRVAKLLVRTETDTYQFYKDRIRWAIGRNSNPDLILPSDCFDVDVSHDAKNRLVSLAINGRGYGHGVGMCQCGAIGRARSGWDFQRILKAYYVGASIKKLY